ncbi:hypothetical protein CERZMDRAFT_91830 [Cercospora zeae-maydis SCOH1-5]|uniref:Uncharacterized protein n=1 Tax=Cercospora zeae-maydis SCOH1-5 TaxID=717836 RepID=A0A6A6F0Z8_9PEZI|nr:hypothetical protein CERZMDRAFT_91830 [Cercospora zeae-maydis SCOH1-5]
MSRQETNPTVKNKDESLAHSFLTAATVAALFTMPACTKARSKRHAPAKSRFAFGPTMSESFPSGKGRVFSCARLKLWTAMRKKIFGTLLNHMSHRRGNDHKQDCDC